MPGSDLRGRSVDERDPKTHRRSCPADHRTRSVGGFGRGGTIGARGRRMDRPQRCSRHTWSRGTGVIPVSGKRPSEITR